MTCVAARCLRSGRSREHWAGLSLAELHKYRRLLLPIGCYGDSAPTLAKLRPQLRVGPERSHRRCDLVDGAPIDDQAVLAVLHRIRAAAVAEAAKETGGLAFACDVTDAASVERAVATAPAHG